MAAISKHQRFDSDGKFIPGKLRVARNSSLRKLMRAARRGKIPDERAVVIDAAVQSAGRNTRRWQNSYARGWNRPWNAA